MEDDAETLKIDRLEDSKNHIQDLHDRNAAREEIDEFEKSCWSLAFLFLMWQTTVRVSPEPLPPVRKCWQLPDWNRSFCRKWINSKKLPMTALAAASGVEKKDVRKTSEVSGGGAAGLYERI